MKIKRGDHNAPFEALESVNSLEKVVCAETVSLVCAGHQLVGNRMERRWKSSERRENSCLDVRPSRDGERRRRREEAASASCTTEEVASAPDTGGWLE